MSFFWEKVIRPTMFSLDAETAHEVGMRFLRLGIGSPVGNAELYPTLQCERFGLKFENPLGIAAGFDKNGLAVNRLSDIGFGFVEVGTVTFEPQSGNPKPRMFRLPKDQAVINRLGFNNQGAVKIAERLRNVRRKCVVGINIGKNKDVANEDAVENYIATLDLVHESADYLAVNISSPNTPNLRELQRADHLEELLSALQKRNGELSSIEKKPLLVKIAPDLTEAEIEGVVDVAMRTEISAIIATNTTISREGLTTAEIDSYGEGGLSGRPLAKRSTEVIKTINKYSKGTIPVIGVGGIFTATDAFEKLAAGASLIQSYTGFIYGGPMFARDIASGLNGLLRKGGFSHVDELVGSHAKLPI